MTYQPASLRCAECRRIARALQSAWRSDNRALRLRLADVAASSGRDVQSLGVRWVFSVAAMPDPDMKVLLQAHYPRVAEATRRRDAHEKTSGHAVMSSPWWTMLLYGPAELE